MAEKWDNIITNEDKILKFIWTFRKYTLSQSTTPQLRRTEGQ